MRSTHFYLERWLAALSLLCCLASAEAKNLEFSVSLSSTASALQFDVSGAPDGVALSASMMGGANTHLVESAVIPQGVAGAGSTRFLIYSPDNSALAAEEVAKVSVSFPDESPLQSNLLTVDQVVASDAEGERVSASPNFLPRILAQSPSADIAVRIGTAVGLSAQAIDLDGLVAQTSLLVDSSALATSSGPSAAATWVPSVSRQAPFSVLVTDNTGQSTTGEPIQLRGFNFVSLASFKDFQEVLFGEDESDPSIVGPSADPFGIGVSNLLAYYIGLDPEDPDFSLLPAFQVDRSSEQPVARLSFSRISNPVGVIASVRQSAAIDGGTEVPAESISTSEEVGGRIPVTATAPVPLTGPLFMHLELQQSQ